ncbi:MAG: hypothetical protein RIR26_1747 [Pseudomonadota bacterium]|jgi:hypothetical protein
MNILAINLFLAGLITASLGCTPNDSSGMQSTTVIAKAQSDASAVSGAKELKEQSSQRSSLFKGVEGFLVKDSERLRATINECLDADLLRVKTEMITQNNTQRGINGPLGRKVILGSNFTAAGGDVIEQVADDLYNPLKTGRSETSAGILNLNYLGALATVADVVAWNCDFSNPNARCNCSTSEGAKKILQRCIPSYTDSQLTEVAKSFYDSCKDPDPSRQREALAAFLSSSTFAESR